jgi:hypothetical protein
MSTQKVKVMKGVPPEVAGNYFAIDHERKKFGSGKTAKRPEPRFSPARD